MKEINVFKVVYDWAMWVMGWGVGEDKNWWCHDIMVGRATDRGCCIPCWCGVCVFVLCLLILVYGHHTEDPFSFSPVPIGHYHTTSGLKYRYPLIILFMKRNCRITWIIWNTDLHPSFFCENKLQDNTNNWCSLKKLILKYVDVNTKIFTFWFKNQGFLRGNNSSMKTCI